MSILVNNMTNERAGFVLPLAILIAILAVSTASILIRFAQADGAPSIVIAALRLTFASVLLAPIALSKYLDEIKRFTRTEILLGAFSGIFLAAHFATWITSLEFTTVASSAVFVSTGPLWVALLSPVLLNERLTGIAVMGLGLSLAGGAMIGLSEACTWNHGLLCPNLGNILRGRIMWGNFLALAGAWAVTGYLIIGRKIRAGMSLIPYIFLVYGVGAITLIIFMFVSGHALLGYSPKAYGWIFLLAIVPQLIGHTTFNWALKYMPASFVAVATLGEPVGSTILAYFMLAEAPTWITIIGGALILLGINIISKTAKS